MGIHLLQYCYYSRELGIIYSRYLDPHGVLNLYAYADASLTVPKSDECSLVMCQGAVIEGHFGTQSTTADSTMRAEYMAAYRASCDIMGMRNMMEELGFKQAQPTLLYEDNQPCLRVVTNPGAEMKRSKTFDLQMFMLRDRVIDSKILMRWCESLKMVADLGTKLLPRKQFVFLRDLMNGYALVAASKNHRSPMSMMAVTYEEPLPFFASLREASFCLRRTGIRPLILSTMLTGIVSICSLSEMSSGSFAVLLLPSFIGCSSQL